MVSREIVIDPSVAAMWFLPDKLSARAEELLDALLNRKVTAAVPAPWFYEVLNTLRVAVRRGRLTTEEAHGRTEHLARIPVESSPAHAEGYGTLLALALEHGLTAYDAAYLALARAHGAQLVTGDNDLLRLRPRFPWIVSLEDFCAQLDEA